MAQMTKDTRGKVRTRNPMETRAKLLQATIDLIAEKGPDAPLYLTIIVPEHPAWPNKPNQ